MSTDGGGWTLIAAGWIPRYDSSINSDIASLGNFIKYTGLGNIPSYTQMRHFCRRNNTSIVHRKRTTPSTQGTTTFSGNQYSNTDVVLSGHNTSVGSNWSQNGSYAELHYYYAASSRFIIRNGNVHCGVDYSAVGGESNNANLGQEGYIYVK